MIFSRIMLVLAIVVQLASCAGDAPLRAARDLSQAGKDEDALVLLEKEILADPRNSNLRLALRTTRERYLARLFHLANEAITRGSEDDSAAIFRKILSLDSGNQVARARLEALEDRVRLRGLIADAERAAEKADWESVEERSRLIAAIRPDHPALRSLRRRMLEGRMKPAERGGEYLAAIGKRVSINLKDASIKTIFDLLAHVSGLSFVFDREVRTEQKTSFNVRDVTVKDALSMITLSNQLESRTLNDKALLIYPATAAKQREYQSLIMRSYYLTNADPKNLAATIRTLVKTRDITLNEKLSLLIVRDTPEAMRIIDRIVALEDLPEPEVMLEVEILEVKRTRLMELGVRFPEQLSLSPLASNGTTLTLADLRRLGQDSTAATISPLTINARREISDVNILANPRIRARNKEKAKILIGEKVPNITTTATATGFVAENIQYIDVGLKLEVESNVSLDDEVTIKMNLEVSSIISQVTGKSGSIAYRIGTRNAATVLRLKDGQNQILAGLINDEDRSTANRVPGLGSIPVLGRLFGSQNDQAEKTEIVLSITPRLIRQIQRPEVAFLDMEAGTEAGVRNFRDSGQSGTTAPTLRLTPTISGDTVPAQMPRGTVPGALRGPASSTGSPAGDIGTPAGSTAAQSADSVRLSLAGPSQVRLGATTTVQLAIQASQLLANVPVVLSFDPKAFEVMSVQESSGSGVATLASRVDATNGQIFATLSAQPSVSETAPTTLLISFSLRAIGQTGKSIVTVVSAQPSTDSGRLLPTTPVPPLAIVIAN